MAIIKCKMCGGDLQIEEGSTVAVCEYCDSRQTIPSVDDEKKVTLFNQADDLRRQKYFDRAATVYERIVADFPEEAEAYWGLVLCNYGIEYVKDPATGERIPTCHRSSFDSVMTDPNTEKTLECADVVARRVYKAEAQRIEEIRKGILEVSSKEEPYDVFICYKETDDTTKNRTTDSVIAQDVYDDLTEKGYRVFFSRITLEDKLGAQYEPYIFAALNSAKIMLVFGTKIEYFNAVWVKNEWSRYLKLMAKDKDKHLIPCYRDINPYDMPEEFVAFQSQDMGKIGATQDLIRGVGKYLPKDEPKPVVQQVVQQVVQGGGPNIPALLKRGNDALEEGLWEDAYNFFDQILNMDATYAPANLGMALSELRAKDLDALVVKNTETLGRPMRKTMSAGSQDRGLEADTVKNYRISHYLEADDIKAPFQGYDFSYESETAGWESLSQKAAKSLQNKNLSMASRNADPGLRSQINQAKDSITEYFNQKIEESRKADGESKTRISEGYKVFQENALKEVKKLRVQAEQTREADYQLAVKKFDEAVLFHDYEAAKDLFRDSKINAYKQSDEYIQKCDAQMDMIIARDAKEHDGNIVRKTWITAIVFAVLMALYTFVGLTLGLRNWALTTLLPILNFAEGGVFTIVVTLASLVLGVILTHKIMKRWDPWGCITMIIKGVVWIYLCGFLTMIFALILAFVGPLIVMLLGEYMAVLLGIISVITQLKKGTGFYKKSNKGKIWLSVLATVAVVALLVWLGGLIVGGNTAAEAFRAYMEMWNSL